MREDISIDGLDPSSIEICPKDVFQATIGLTTLHQTVGLLTFQAVTPGPNAVAPVPNVTGPRRELKNNRIVLDYLTFKI